MIESAIQSDNRQPMDINHLIGMRQKAFEQGISVMQALEETSGYSPDELTCSTVVMERDKGVENIGKFYNPSERDNCTS